MQMHGTGTPLGDPIEVGAIAASLMHQVDRGRTALALMAAKSWVGHAEPAAGMVGLAHAAAAFQQTTVLPILHLRWRPIDLHKPCGQRNAAFHTGVLDGKLAVTIGWW